jgi:hypothetical protein
MVLDTAHRYVWGTHGSGALTIEVGGDSRSPRERREYASSHQGQFGSSVDWLDFPAGVFANVKPERFVFRDSLRYRRFDSAGRYYFRADSLSGRIRLRVDSLTGDSVRKVTWFTRNNSDSLVSAYFRALTDTIVTRLGRGRGAGRGGGGGGAADTVGAYTTGWGGRGGQAGTNHAIGLRAAGSGESGIAGLPSANVASADVFAFRPNELASQGLRVMVVHLTPGTAWNRR